MNNLPKVVTPMVVTSKVQDNCAKGPQDAFVLPP